MATNCADPSCEALSRERLLADSVGARNAAGNTLMNNTVGDSTGIPTSAIQDQYSFGGNGFGTEEVSSRKRSNTAQSSAGTTDKDGGISRMHAWSSITLSTDTPHEDTSLADAQYTDRLSAGKVQVGLVPGRGDRNLSLSLPTKVGMDRTLDRDCAVTASESCEGGVSDGKYSDVVGGKRDLSAPNSSSTRTLRTDWLHTTITDNSSIDSLDSLVPAQQPSYAAPRPSPPSPSVSNDSGSASARPASSEPEEQPASQETFYGFIKDAIDALLVIEACLKGLLSPFKSGSDASGQLAIRSGTVIVFAESSTQMKRWRDGERWSPSRAHGPFLLYGEVESVRTATDARDAATTAFAVIPGLDPSFSTKTLKSSTRLVQHGLRKKTITLIGSDGQRHRVISYYNRNDVLHLYPDAVPETPSACFGEGPSNAHDSSVSQDSFKNLTTPSLTPTLKAILDTGDIDFKQLLAQSITSDNFGRPKQPVAASSTSKSGGPSMRSSITADNIEAVAGKRLRSGVVKSYAENDEEDEDDDDDFGTPVTQVSHRRTRSSASASGAIERMKEAVAVQSYASKEQKNEPYSPHIPDSFSVQSRVPESRNSHAAPLVGESKRDITLSEHQPVHTKVESFARRQHQQLPQGQPRLQSTSVRHEPLHQTQYELLHQTSNSGTTTSIPPIPFEQHRPTHILYPQQPHFPVNHLPPISEATRQITKNFHQPLLLPPPTGAQNLPPWKPFSRTNLPSEQSRPGVLPPFRAIQTPLQNRPYVSPAGEGAKPGITPSNQLLPSQQHYQHFSGYSQAPYLPPPINPPRQQPYPSTFEYTNRWNQQQ